MSDPPPVELLAFIRETFDMEELKTPSFQLGIHFDEIEGEIREAKARELIEFMQRNNRLPEPASK